MRVCVCVLFLQAWLAESSWAFLLVLVVLSTASAKREKNYYFGLSIGAIVLTGDQFFGEWSQGMFNPAVGLGTCIIAASQHAPYNGLWIYLVCPPLLPPPLFPSYPPPSPSCSIDGCVLCIQTACTLGGMLGSAFDKYLFSDEVVNVIAAPAKDDNANVPHERLDEEDAPAQI